MRIDKISLYLLQYKEQNKKTYGLNRIGYQNQEGAQNTANKCTKNRDQRSKGNQHTYQQSIRQVENTHGKKEHGSKNNCFQALSCNKIREGTIT
ncbi:hypothetical protein EVA_11200 [gut metagenome]|uniref:Uncharacterized protein n=1 Tax=gut metagenome TaxID=749906 RepID=J9G0D6_9ZZZZ